MKKGILAFLLFLGVLQANWDPIAQEEEDPTLFHNVHVISGHFNARFEDLSINGAIPIHLFRTYTSSGALEPLDSELMRLMRDRARGSWHTQGGWTLLPHTNLFEFRDKKAKFPEVYVVEPSGNMLNFYYSKKKKGFIHSQEYPLHSTKPSALTNPTHYKMTRDEETSSYHLKLGVMGERVYAPHDKLKREDLWTHKMRVYLLQEEILPSGHILAYTYQEDGWLERVRLLTPDRSKTLSYFFFRYSEDTIDVHSSDGQHIVYYLTNIDGKTYYRHRDGKNENHESFVYSVDRKNIGARAQKVYIGPTDVYEFTYYPLGSGSKDKVETVKGPLGPDGEMKQIAQFTYSEKMTEVRDVENLLIRYHHDGTKLLRIEYFNEKEQLHSALVFQWDKERLIAKTLLNGEGSGEWGKTFTYDIAGNVVKETLYGSMTGRAPPPYTLLPDGSLKGAETYVKRFRFDPETQLPIEENQDHGPSFLYSYKKGTNLLTAKCTIAGQGMCLREMFNYDSDHLLSEEIHDNGSSYDLSSLYNVFQRQIFRYKRSEKERMIGKVEEVYYDPIGGQERPLKTVVLGYGSHRQLGSEKVFDAEGEYRYKLEMDYQSNGCLKSKTTPLGKKNQRGYDRKGRVAWLKEVGSPKKTFLYDGRGIPLSCTEGGLYTKSSVYDSKGRLLTQIDDLGREIHQTYDAFGNCTSVTFPKAFDEREEAYSPTVHYTYDIAGNLTSTKTSGGVTTTSYNIYRKPTKVIHPDGSTYLYRYNLNGTLFETEYPDGSLIHCAYDSLQNLTQQTHFSPNGEVLSSQVWTYHGPLLTSHLDDRNLHIKYTYDGAGRKIGETAEGKTVTYSYDSLGYLERTTYPHETEVQIHNEEGLVTSSWIEDIDGTIENRVDKTYDEENRLVLATTYTQGGSATDQFTYDLKNRLIEHTDPLGSTTTITYDDTRHDSFGSRILRKITEDPAHNQTIEVYDANGRLTTTLNKDPEGNTLRKRSITYDRAGNKVLEKISYPHSLRTLSRTYDLMGRVLSETESGKKTTHYSYDTLGHLTSKELPSGKTLYYTHDPVGRLLDLQSSDKTVDYHYVYTIGPDPLYIFDRVHQTTHCRTYDSFGNLLSEKTPNGLTYTYSYDPSGRLRSFILPDATTLTYTYRGRHLTAISRDAYTHTYDQFCPQGRAISETTPLGTTISRCRDLLDRPTLTTTSFHTEHITYNTLSLPTHIANTLLGPKSYTYDPLHQLQTENDHTYHFDSLGNPTNLPVNTLNQIQSTPEGACTYDLDGNLTSDSHGTYAYDALGRLIQLNSTLLSYDSYNRLLTIQTATSTEHLLYNHQEEIGTLNKSLKVRASNQPAIAIELSGALYLPLHDHMGNIIALVNQDAQISEISLLDAFGRGNLSTQSPWSFSEKRIVGHLIYFGHRFYHPSLGRWLTPDPSGYTDSPNLYLYVLNRPTSRLDRFGLFSEDFYIGIPASAQLYNDALQSRFQGSTFPQTSLNTTLFHSPGMLNTHNLDYFLAGNALYKLAGTPEELKNNQANLFDQFHRMLPKEGSQIGVITLGNGINTSLGEFQQFCTSLQGKVPDSALIIGKYNNSYGLPRDLVRAVTHYVPYEDISVIKERQFLESLVHGVDKVNPELKVLAIYHSEGAALYLRAYQGMTDENKARMQRHLIVVTLGAQMPIPNNFGVRVINYYSTRDFVTYRPEYRLHPKYKDYDIRLVRCSSTPAQMTIPPFVDHAYLGNTYQFAESIGIKNANDRFGFFSASD